MKFLNDPSDVLWLLSTHLKGRYAPSFRSFLLFGNEDSPEKVQLFASQAPSHDDPFFEINLMEES